MKRQNIVPAIIILAAIVLSTFVLADTPVIPGDATTSTSDEPSETPDAEIVVEGERDEDGFPWFEGGECIESDDNRWDYFDTIGKDAERTYRSELRNAESAYYECRGCVEVINPGTIPNGWDCRLGHQPGSSEFDACWQEYELARELAHEKYESALSDDVIQNWLNCFEQGVLDLFE